MQGETNEDIEESELSSEQNKQIIKMGKVEVEIYDGLLHDTRGGLIVLNGNEESEAAQMIHSMLGVQALKEINDVKEILQQKSPGSVRITSGDPYWQFIAHAIITDSRKKLCTIKRMEKEMETIMSSLIKIATSSGLKELHMPLIGSGHFGHSTNAMVKGIISGIISNSEEEFLKINLLMNNRDREEFRREYERTIKKQDELMNVVDKTPIREVERLDEVKTDSESSDESLEEEREIEDLNSTMISAEHELSEEEQIIRKETRLRNKRGVKIQLQRVTKQIQNDWPEVEIKGTMYRNPSSEKRDRELLSKWDKKNNT